MKTLSQKIRKVEFEVRIFISLGIVLTVCLLSFLAFPDTPSNFVLIGNVTGASPEVSTKAGFYLLALLVVFTSALRMWAGTVLSSPRVMSFRIQKEALFTEGPYQLTRNPIYLADFISFCGFVFCLPPVGLALPLLFFVHYTQLILYEEEQLRAQFGAAFEDYQSQTPRFIPNLTSLRRLPAALGSFRINRDGARHNSQYILLVPGFIVSAYTGNLLHAILIGLPAVLDWAVVHTKIGLHPHKGEKAVLTQSKVFRDILYAQCWEDPETDREAFRAGKDDVVFSITSGGCNTLAFLIDNPIKVIALDLSPYQNYLLDLKMAAFRELGYEDLLGFLGVSPSDRRLERYALIREHLRPDSQAYWDAQTKKISAGVIHCGRYERYMRLLKRGLEVLVGRSLPQKLFACENDEERKQLYEQKWNNSRWRFFTGIFLSRRVMTLLFTGKFFEQIEDDFAFSPHFQEKIRRALTEIPLKENYFLAYILLGRFYDSQRLPVYLRRENYEKIRDRLDRIEIVTGDCCAYFNGLPEGAISRFNFSNIFEWMTPQDFEKVLRSAIRVACHGAVFTYRNLLVPRSRPESLARWIKPDQELSAALLALDRSFIYKAFNVETVNKETWPTT